MAVETIPLRLFCKHPHSENFGLQNKNKEINIGSPVNDTQVAFDFELKVKQTNEGQPNFTGEFAHGTLKERFVYLTTKDHQGRIIRRIKVPLKTIQWEQVQEVLDTPDTFLVGQVEAHTTGTVPLLNDGWVVRSKTN